jgi:hypothetical protein
MRTDAPYFIILLCLTPDDFTRQGESAATQWVNQTICPCTLLTLYSLSGNAPYFIILLCLTPDDFTRQGESAATQWVRLKFSLTCKLSIGKLGVSPLYRFAIKKQAIKQLKMQTWLHLLTVVIKYLNVVRKRIVICTFIHAW